jgi:hypothetical protein
MLTKSGKHVCAYCGNQLKNYEYYNYECKACNDYEQNIRDRVLKLLGGHVTDYKGSEVPKDEKEGTMIKVWEVSPHPGYIGDYDYYIERSWQNMLEYMKENFNFFLDQYDEEDLKEGVNLNIKLVDMTLGEYLDILEYNQP